MRTLQAATDRLFRDYYAHCRRADEDTLFHLLNALHSFSDKLPRARRDLLFGSPSFIGLKALRNLFHHEAELLDNISVISDFEPTLSVELMRVCLIERVLIERAAAAATKQATRQKRSPPAVEAAFNWYGDVADIEPAIFNVMVDVYEGVRSIEIVPTSRAFRLFEQSYVDEARRGIEHRLQGRISCHAANAGEVLLTMHEKVLQRREAFEKGEAV
jgi:hypothetical protein